MPIFRADVAAMGWLTAVLDLGVAGVSVVLAVKLRPQTPRPPVGSGVVRVARWSAITFLVAGALTQLTIGVTGLSSAGRAAAAVAQLAGATVLLAVGSRLRWSVQSRDAADRLQDREQHFRAAFEAASIGVIVFAVDTERPGRLLEVNQGMCTILGRPAPELVGRPLQDFVALGDRVVADRHLTQLREGPGIAEQELDLQHADGHRVRVEIGSVQVPGSDDSPPLGVARVRDITRQRRTEMFRNVDHDVIRALAAAESTASGVAEALRCFCAALGWVGAEYWQADAGGVTMQPLTAWWSSGSAGTPDPERQPVRRGQDLPGAVWEAGHPIWVQDLVAGPSLSGRVARVPIADAASAVGIPIGLDGPIGVVVLLLPERTGPDPELSGALEALAAALARFLERRRADELRQLMESAPDAAVIADRSGRIVRVNARTEQLFGYTREELINADVETLVPGWFRGPAGDVTDTGSLKPQPEAGSVEAGELHGRRKDGRQFPVEISVSPLRTADGTLISSSIRDVTDRRSADAVRRQLAAIVDSAKDAIISTDLKGIVQTWNHGAENVFGYTEAEMIGRSGAVLLLPGATSPLDGRLASVGEEGMTERYEAVRRHQSGRAINVSISMSGIRDPLGRATGVAATIRDITDERRAAADLLAAKEAAEASRDALQSFSYSVAHDLKIPLRAIDGYCFLLGMNHKDVLDDDGQDLLGRVRTAAQRMATLIDGLLNLSRVTHRDLLTDTVDLSALARSVTSRLRQGDPDRRVDVVVESGLSAIGDRTLLGSMLENLLANAWKFTRDTPEAMIEFGSDHAGYFVRDNGVGFDMAYADKLFGVFQRLHSVEDFEGTGIGLATAQRIVERHGGRIWADSAPGRGAIFRFTLQETESPAGPLIPRQAGEPTMIDGRQPAGP